ncbi:MAG TPA: alginate lyase family protein [Pyrinomonadaceae bacterium]
MGLNSELRRMLRGKVDARTIALESKRRLRVARERRRERSMLAELDQQSAQLRERFARMSAAELASHFRSRTSPKFFPGFASLAITAERQKILFPEQTNELLQAANRIVEHHSWPLLGLGERCFGANEIEWHRDPLSARLWPLSYHADVNLFRNDGSDARLVWELNRLGHFLTLGRAYAITNDERFSAEFFSQLASWRAQNPVGRGVNWTSAMEVALRAMNLLAALALFLRAPQMDQQLPNLLTVLDQHGAHIQRNLEFSYLGASNHYLSNVVGLLWLGLLLPELTAADGWLEFGARELSSEVQKQILLDGAHFECSTGYHRYVLELLLYSLLLLRNNEVKANQNDLNALWPRLRSMLEYVRAYLRPDGIAPLIGDSDSGQVLPLVRRAGNDHAYVLALGAVACGESRFKIAGSAVPEELLWIFGEAGVDDYQAPIDSPAVTSSEFRDVKTFVLRDDDNYLLLNAGAVGMNGRGSHRHNDALSVEVSACGRAFIVDPGTYVYTADLHARHLFRSTAYHSTIEIDDTQQRPINEQTPFAIESDPATRVLAWELTPEHDYVQVEHAGYENLPAPVVHRRAVTFHKADRWWLIEDELFGKGDHKIATRFHFDYGLEVKELDRNSVIAFDSVSGARLVIRAVDLDEPVELQPQFTSRQYGCKRESVSACWISEMTVPCKLRWAIIPVCPGDDLDARIKVACIRMVGARHAVPLRSGKTN